MEIILNYKSFPGGTVVKNPPANAGDKRNVGQIPGSGRSPGAGNGKPLQYSCPENSVGRGACWAMVHGAADLDMNDQLSTLNINVLSPPQKGKSCQTGIKEQDPVFFCLRGKNIGER